MISPKQSYIQGNEKVSKDEFSSSTESEAIYASRFTNSQSRDNISDISEDWSRAIKNVKSGTRRKHHRLWTLPEVMKLIEGVSRYGVGRWTEIKRLLFPTSAFRSSVDLKVLDVSFKKQCFHQFGIKNYVDLYGCAG